MATIKLTPLQSKQYAQLKQQFNVTKKEFIEFYEDVRKANRKGKRLTNTNALKIPKFSLKVGSIKSREDFRKRKKSIKGVLERDYRVKANIEQRDNFRKNLALIYGTKEGNKLYNEKFKNMTDNQLKDFLNQNQDLTNVAYYQGKVSVDATRKIKKYIEVTGITEDIIVSRVETFNRFKK